MKKIVGVAGVLLLIFSCSGNKISKEPMVGNDRDKNNCIGSAGYQWSQLKKECIRPFEVGVKLNSVKNSGYACYLIFNNNEVEIFSKETSPSVILQKEGDKIWKKGDWEVVYKKEGYNLKKGGETLYGN